MLNLSLLLLERVGIVIILAFVLVNVRPFRKLLYERKDWSAKVQLIVIFALFAIISNLTGVKIDSNNNVISSAILTNLPETYSIANTRILAITVAGIIGGPEVGTVVGIIAGIHRVMQGGSTGWFYIISSSIIGFSSGFLFKSTMSRGHIDIITPSQGIFVGFFMEVIQMMFISFFSPTGLELVKFIAVPMIMLNSVGTYIFLSIIQTSLNQEQEARAIQTHSVLELADKTLPYFRAGLNPASAQKVANIIKDYTNFAAISLTTTNRILAHVGAGSDHHLAGERMITKLSMRAIRNGELEIAYSKKEIGCSHPDCPLEAAVIIPLWINDAVVGTLKMYYTDAQMMTTVEEQLAAGLGSIFSSQLALGAAETQSKLVKDAEIKSLQAQINPHFFFNAINTISAMMRKDSEQARSLLLQLSTYFRANLMGVRETEITLEQEQRHVQAYLSLEQTRFPDKFEVHQKILAPRTVKLPPFTIQVLVENAVKHAFSNRKQGNLVEILIEPEDDKLKIKVTDNGSGIDPDKLPSLGVDVVESSHGSGTALQNLNQRLVGLYGKLSSLQFDSTATGTSVTIWIPLKEGD